MTKEFKVTINEDISYKGIIELSVDQYKKSWIDGLCRGKEDGTLLSFLFDF